MSEIQDVLSTVATHPDYTEISHDEYMELWDGSNPLYDLHREQDSCRVFVDPTDEDDFVTDISPAEIVPDSHYRISPSEGIKESLEALEEAGFKHQTTDPPTPNEDPFAQVFKAIEKAGSDADQETDQDIFDGRYQCRSCGQITEPGTFAGAAKPPKKVGTDCPNCEREEGTLNAIYPGSESVMHRWTAFWDMGYDTVTAGSRTGAREQASNDYPDQTIDAVLHEERIDDG